MSESTEKITPVTPIKKEKKSKDGLYILIILILLLGAGYLGWEISKKNKALNECTFNNTELNNELGDMNEMMYEQGLAQGESLKENLQMMLSDYETMENLNTDLNDSISEQKAKIQTILEELEKEKGNKRYYARKVRELTEETETLRAIMKDYVRTIDSLRTDNLILQSNLENTKIDLTNVSTERDNYKSQTEELTDKVNAGSKLTAASILTEGIKQKGSGSYKVTTKANRCTHIRSCFDITENRIASSGNKTIYMRIITPQGGVLHSSTSNTLTTEDGKTLLYSDKKSINYQNQSINVCIFYKLTKGITKGNYIAELWSEGVRIGVNKFVLK
jgi:hypothetical protein